MSDIMTNVANSGAMPEFGSHSAEEVRRLQKALSISQNYATTAAEDLTGGSALAAEDLSRTLKMLNHTLEHLRLWKDINKEQVSQEVYQFNTQSSYGAETSPFFTMGGTPEGTDAVYNRDYGRVKYLGTKGSVLHNLTMIQSVHGPVIARETKNKSIELLSKNERAMFESDSAINALEYDGLEAQMVAKQGLTEHRPSAFVGYESAGSEDTVIIDARKDGAAREFDEDVAEHAALVNVNNIGMGTDMYMGTDIHSKFSKQFNAKQRTVPGAVLMSGNRVKQHEGTLDYNFKPSLFNRPRKTPLAVSVSASAAPTTANGARTADAASEFETIDAGTYSYRISAVYADGETLPSTAETIASIVAGDKVTTEITFTGTPLWFNVFRAPVGTTAGHEFIGRIKPLTSGAAHNIDFNSVLPGSAKAFLLMHDPEVLCWKQLGSLSRYSLAVTNTSYNFLVLLYGNPLMMAVRKNVMIKNLDSSRATSF